MAVRPLRRRARGRGGRAPGRAGRAPAAAARWWWTWTRRSPTSSATRASPRRGPLLWLAEALERHALRQVRGRDHGLRQPDRGRATARARRRACSRSRTRRSWTAPAPAAAATWPACARRSALDARPVVLYSGNFEPYQGVELLVDAAARVPEAQFAASWAASRRRSRRCATRAAALGAADRCVFAGKRPPAELPLLPGARRRARLARAAAARTRRSRSTPTSPRASRWWRRASRRHTQLLDDSLAFLVEPTAERPGRGHPRRRWPTRPRRARAPSAAGP